MKELFIRKWHRSISIVIAPLLFLQAISGMVLSIDWLLGLHQRFGEVLKGNVYSSPLAELWDTIFVTIHYGLGVGGAMYHIALGITTAIVAVSGFMIFLKIRERQKKKAGGT